MIHTELLATVNLIEELNTKTLFGPFSLGPFDLVFTSHMLVIALAAILLMITLPLSLHRPRLVPCGFANLIETVCVFLREDVAAPFLKDRTDRYIPVLWTLFFYILTMNLLGLTPLKQIYWMITQRPNDFGGAPTANIWITGALATFSFLLFHLAGIFEQGFWNYLKSMCPPVPWFIRPFMFVMELLSSFVRLFSLAIRLFANILAGHILLSVIMGFIFIYKNFMVATVSITGAILMSFLEIFVAFLQAYIFVFLTTIFISFAISHEEH